MSIDSLIRFSVRPPTDIDYCFIQARLNRFSPTTMPLVDKDPTVVSERWLAEPRHGQALFVLPAVPFRCVPFRSVGCTDSYRDGCSNRKPGSVTTVSEERMTFHAQCSEEEEYRRLRNQHQWQHRMVPSMTDDSSKTGQRARFPFPVRFHPPRHSYSTQCPRHTGPVSDLHTRTHTYGENKHNSQLPLNSACYYFLRLIQRRGHATAPDSPSF